jgi:hypothetical protein
MLDFVFDAGAGVAVVPVQDGPGGGVVLASWDPHAGDFSEHLRLTCGKDEALLANLTLSHFHCMSTMRPWSGLVCAAWCLYCIKGGWAALLCSARSGRAAVRGVQRGERGAYARPRRQGYGACRPAV